MFNEFNPRVPGAWSVPCFQDCTGLNFLDMQLSSILNQEYEPQPIDEYSCFLLLPRCSGTVEALNEPNLDSRVESFWLVSVGDKIEQSSTMVDSAAWFRLYNKSYEQLAKDFWSLKDFKAVTVS